MIINIRPLLRACEDHFVQLDEVTRIKDTVTICHDPKKTHDVVSRNFCNGTSNRFGVLLSRCGQWAVPFKEIGGIVHNTCVHAMDKYMVEKGYQSMIS